jgi:hypothetical protein
VSLGLLLGVFISAATYYNDRVAAATPLIANHLPIIVYGTLVLAVLAINPLLSRLGVALGRGDLAVAVVIATAACGWPGSGLMRQFASTLVLPSHLQQSEADWQTHEVLSYAPGGAPSIAPGHVADWPGLLATIRQGQQADALWAARLTALGDSGLRQALDSSVDAAPDEGTRYVVLRALRLAIWDAQFAEALGISAAEESTQAVQERAWAVRHELSSRWPELIRTPTPGEPLIMAERSNQDPAVRPLISGGSDDREPPWDRWWPLIRVWGSLLLVLGLASVCLALIVHPQWSKHESLGYPVVQFVEELTAGVSAKAGLPSIAASRVFWLGLLAVMGYHLINGIHMWFPAMPHIDRWFNLIPLNELFPAMRRMPDHGYLLTPSLFPIVVAFGYFIHVRVALSVFWGVVLWVLAGTYLIGAGIPVKDGMFDPGVNGTTVRFGSYLAAAGMILYFGRRHYLAVAGASVGLVRDAAVRPPGYCVWAFRALIACCLAALLVLNQFMGLTVLNAVLLVGVVLIMWLVLSRIHVETGLIFIGADFLPVALLAGLLGTEGLGIEGLAVLMLASILLVAQPREAVMPYLVNGLKLGTTVGQSRPSRLVWPIVAMVIVGLAVTFFVTLHVQQNHGIDLNDRQVAQGIVPGGWDMVSRETSRLALDGSLADSVRLSSAEQLGRLAPVEGAWMWLLIGIGLYLACAIARLRLPWWPLHPVAFLVWGTTAASNLSFSFLLAGIIKGGTLSLGGENAYRAGKPLMIGVIAGELLAALGWAAVNLAYFLIQQQAPEAYHVLP